MENIHYQLLLQICATFILMVLSGLTLPFLHSLITRYGIKNRIIKKRVAYIKKFFSIIFYTIVLLCFALIWGIDFKGVFIFASSFFAVVGIALFASWSVLSNITASIILFFSFPYKLGDTIKILDGDNTFHGKLMDITMFNLQIEDQDGNIVVLPNNIALQKAIIKYARKK